MHDGHERRHREPRSGAHHTLTRRNAP